MTLIIEENKSLKNFNTFGVDANARYFATVRTVAELQTLLAQFESPFILGGGSNVLFTKNVDSLVIHNGIMGIEKIDENDDHVFLKVGAGENWHQFVLYCIKNNYGGVENLSLIPGTIGATPVQNIGAYGVELKDVLESVDIIPTVTDGSTRATQQSNCVTLSNQQCHFGYRDSIFKHELKNQFVITHVTFRLHKKPVFHLAYGAIKEMLGNNVPTIKLISDAVIHIRQSKLPDPAVIGNAGSFFKNPIVDETLFLVLQQKNPKMPYFKEENALVKIPAGWLIEECGFKGKRFGSVGVHEHQALVLVNYGNGTGDDIKKLSELIQKTVFEKFGITLTTEVNII